MTSERQIIKKLFADLTEQPLQQFPQSRAAMEAPLEQGVYIIRNEKNVLHVGRTLRRKNGIYGRLNDHLNGGSSFAENFLKPNEITLRQGHTYQYLVVKDNRLRALLEAYSIGMLCPKHIGLGE